MKSTHNLFCAYIYNAFVMSIVDMNSIYILSVYTDAIVFSTISKELIDSRNCSNTSGVKNIFMMFRSSLGFLLDSIVEKIRKLTPATTVEVAGTISIYVR